MSFGLILLLAAALIWITSSGASSASERFQFVAFGDLQDETREGRTRDRLLIETINDAKPAFSVYIGDIKGGGVCSDALYGEVRSVFDMHIGPLVFTPGDNEWTDCWQEAAGSRDPVERKRKVIERFTAAGQSLGQTPMALQQQPGMRENARWHRGNITFGTLHITGSNNNLRQDEQAVVEHFERSRQNLDWLRLTFLEAQERGDRAMVLFFHANPKWGARWWDPTGFDRFRDALGEAAAQFAKPILVVHGDTHTFRIDTPERAIPNLTRLEVFGPPSRGAILIDVNASSSTPFAFSPIKLD